MNRKKPRGIQGLWAQVLKQFEAGVNYVRLLKRDFIAADLPLKITAICIALILLAIIIL